MRREDVHAVWAPPESPWSPWVKPVVFARLPTSVDAAPTEAEDIPSSWLANDVAAAGYRQNAPPRITKVAAIVDVPGPRSVRVALGLAALGMRPIPLFNALPGSRAIVDVISIQRALVGATQALTELQLPPDAPPAFVVDSERQRENEFYRNQHFDNRWVVFATDLPSGKVLRLAGIESVIMLRAGTVRAAGDLATTLRDWQSAGLALYVKNIDTRSPPVTLAPPRFSRLKRLWSESILGVRRRPGGEFGEWVTPSTG